MLKPCQEGRNKGRKRGKEAGEEGRREEKGQEKCIIDNGIVTSLME